MKKIKDKFHKHYKEDLFCPLSCENTLYAQEHLLFCIGIKKHLSIKQLELLAKTQYEHLFGDLIDQLGAANAFQLVLGVRERLLDEIRRPAYHGNSSGPTD